MVRAALILFAITASCLGQAFTLDDPAFAGNTAQPAAAPAFSPLDLSPYFWYCAASNSYSAGSIVTNLTDLSGNNRNVVSNSTANKTYYTNSYIGGLPTVYWAGGSASYAGLTNGIKPSGSNITLFTVCMPTNQSAANMILINCSWSDGFLMREYTNKTEWYFRSASCYINLAAYAPRITVYRRAGAQLYLANTATNTTGTVNASYVIGAAATPFAFGNSIDGSGGAAFCGGISEIIYYQDTALSDANVTKVMDYLKLKYGL